MNKPTVSILTLTQLSRNDSLKITYDCILNQTYDNIKEWIIVDASQTVDEGTCNKALIDDFIKSHQSKFTIKYIPHELNSTIGTLKNKANHNATGEYIIWFDDDDYHMPGRIEYSVNKLMHNNKSVGGNINVYIHNINTGKTYKTNNNDLVSNSLIYKKMFLLNHSFPNNSNFNDKLFLGTELSNMETLIPETTFVKLYHYHNTNKHLSNLVPLEDNVRKFLIPNSFYERFQTVFKSIKPQENNDDYLNYDIVYFTGFSGIVWDPSDQKLGGSEQAVVKLSESWVKFNKTVVVYGNFDKEQILNGVEYKFAKTYPIDKKAKVLIIWRLPGVVPFLELEFKADKSILDLHDNFSYTLAHLDRTKLMKFLERITKANFKSIYHKNCFEEFINGKIEDTDFNIIPNGLRVDDFKVNKENVLRNPYRFCYCSSYDRGLEYILENVWPHVYAKEPRAEFHVYYGMDYIFNEQYKNKMRLLLSQPGVMDHGRQPMDIIIREKYLSSFHLYLSDTEAEIDCISIRESLITGCIPIISKLKVFGERHGIQYIWEPTNKNLGKMIGEDLVTKMYDTKSLDNAREQLKNSNTIISWTDVAQKWLDTF
jgi:glycosyltransferase involved in cell wall biosynthesis